MTNFERITKDKKSLINFVMYEVLDLAGPHMDHSIENFRTQKKFSDWLDRKAEVAMKGLARDIEDENARLKTELTATRSRLVDTKKALYLACKTIDTCCPGDLKDGDSVCKELDCDDYTAGCWREYFLMKVRGEI